MKELLEWIDENGGIFTTLFELGCGLAILIMLVRCAAG